MKAWAKGQALKGVPVGFSLGILVVLAAGFGGCENPWMKEAVAPLYKNKDGGDNGPPPVPTLYSIEEITAYLAAATVTPVPLAVALDLSGSEWLDLLGVIDDAGKTVTLNLSACTPSGSSGCLYTSGPDVIFNPDYTNPAGKDKIVSLVLPNAATSIEDGDVSNATFKDFSGLKSVIGANIDDVGEYAFRNCTTLTTVSFPKAVTIDRSAFWECFALTTVNLPKVTSIDVAAFLQCTSLTTLRLPEVTNIGNNAISGCTVLETVYLPKAVIIDGGALGSNPALETVDLPMATTFGPNAFSSNPILTTVNLPMATNIGNYAFRYCVALITLNLPAAPPILGAIDVFADTGPSGTLTIHVPAGAVGNYMSTWGVSDNTLANGDEPKYGINHKAINIVDDLP
ncbi:MAG: leucine-rich repeat domain-containing protein [Spirochaetaceae bacterium]|jgi:hypothetical protein|nr:leucine-rich repeat domain-containing protein [Spirochaetaceae bacterium]